MHCFHVKVLVVVKTVKTSCCKITKKSSFLKLGQKFIRTIKVKLLNIKI